MKLLKKLLCFAIITVLCVSAFSVSAAFETQKNDVEMICDFAVEYVNSGSDEVFTEYMSEKIAKAIDDDDFESSKFIFLYEQDPELTDKTGNQLSKMIAVIGDIYVNGGNAKLVQSDIDMNVTPGYGVGSNDYEDDDAEEFMEIINEYETKLSSTPVSEQTPVSDETEEGMPPEKNEKTEKEEKKSEGGTSVGVVIFISVLVSCIVFVAGTYALRQVDGKGHSEAGGDVEGDDVFNLRLAVKSMQTSLQKADGNFKELDKLRLQVDELDDKIEQITDYLRKISKID